MQKKNRRSLMCGNTLSARSYILQANHIQHCGIPFVQRAVVFLACIRASRQCSPLLHTLPFFCLCAF